MDKKVETNEELNKSIDSLLEDLFKAKPEKIAIAEKKPSNEKPMEAKKPPMSADEGLKGIEAEEGEEEKDGERGRPKDPSNMSHRSKDGASKLEYDSSITSPAKKVPNESMNSPAVQKSFEVSKEDYELLQKAKTAQKEEELRKVKTEQADLIKAAVREAIAPMKQENEQLRKSLAEQEALIKAFAKKPQQRKSVSSVAVLEKSFGGEAAAQEAGEKQPRQETFTKSDMLDAAEELMKSKAFTVNDVIELEDTGYIYDAGKRKLLEQQLRKRS